MIKYYKTKYHRNEIHPLKYKKFFLKYANVVKRFNIELERFPNPPFERTCVQLVNVSTLFDPPATTPGAPARHAPFLPRPAP